MSGVTDDSRPVSPAALGRMDRAAFVAAFGSVFEHSPWVAELTWAAAPFGSLDELHAAMVRACRGAGRERHLALLRAHPDLAGKAAVAGGLTAASRDEQTGAGLDRCTPQDYARFQDLNAAYKAKFGFPFILAVKGHDRAAILAAFAARLKNDPEAEFDRALDEVARIARFRLAELIES